MVKKPWYMSAIMWVNIITGVLELFDYIVGIPGLSPAVNQVILILIPALNIVLRMLRPAQPITDISARKTLEVELNAKNAPKDTM